MKLLDTVALLVEVNGASMDDKDLRLSRGQVGTVVENGDADCVIVEFAGEDGMTYALASVARSNLLRLHHDRPRADSESEKPT